MSSRDAGDWVRQGTPRGADWEDEQSEYGTALDPTEWDDHATEQSVPVETPNPRPRPATRAAGAQDFSGAPAQQPTTSDMREKASRSESIALHAPDVSFQTPTTPSAQEDDAANEPTMVSGLRMPEPRDPDPRPAPSFTSTPAPTGPENEETFARPLSVPQPEQAFPQRVEPVTSQQPGAGSSQLNIDAWPLEMPEQHEQPAPQKKELTLEQRLGGESGQEVPAESAESAEAPRPRPEQVPPQYPDPTATQRFERVRTQPAQPTVEPVASQPDEQQQTSSATSPGLFRGDVSSEPETTEETDVQPEATAVVQAPPQEVPTPITAPTPIPISEQEEERRRREKLEAERAARNERLGVVETSPKNASRALVEKPRRTTDGPLASLGLFFLRLITAAILTVLAYQGLTNVDGTAEALSRTHLPEPRMVVWIGGFLLAAMALLLVIGLLQRVVGVLLLVMAICSLAFIRWGAFSPFLPGIDGFLGDRDLLLGAVALLLICLGGGGWGIDAAFRHSRDAAKEAVDQ